MPNYRYQVRSSNGQVTVGVVSADSAVSAAAALRSQGGHVLDLTPIQSGIAGSALGRKIRELNNGRPSLKHVLDFTTQLAVMIHAGISLRAALDGIVDQTTHASFKRVIQGLKSDVEAGRQFSEAIQRHPKLFNPLYVNMVRASEVSGSFAAMLQRIAANIAQQIETKKMVIGAMIYPAIIGTMAVGVTIFLLTFVLPKFAGVFEGKEDALPAQTLFLMGLSDFMVKQWPIVLASVVGGFFGLFFFLKTEIGKEWLDRTKLGVPILKRMFRSLYISRSLQTMGELINAGVPMLDTIAITSEISGNRLYKRMWRTVYANVKEGKKIATPLATSTLLPKAVVQMISAGEESGKLGEVLSEISDFYAKQLKDNIKSVTSMIEPIMIIIMGSIVGFIAMAIILPIFKMSQIVG
ncbi:MAG: type II secretion system F family protein [Phycisphaeraceae bacterium]|nr:type II secretion system F family protein [Phycisphaeraceae bacterium]MCB9847931.1 type II secretion system F family protein [Phycisphaeraceae bacterium]